MRKLDSYTTRTHNIAGRLLHSASAFCKLNIMYDSGLPPRITNRLVDTSGMIRRGYADALYLTGWHILTSGTTRPLASGMGLEGFREMSRLIQRHFIPHNFADETNTKSVSRGTTWNHGLDSFVDEFLPELRDPELVETGRELQAEFQQFYHSCKNDSPDLSLYERFWELIDEKTGVPARPQVSLAEVSKSVFGTASPASSTTVYAASSRAALDIHTLLQNETGDAVLAEYLRLKEKYAQSTIRLKLWQDFTAAAYPQSPALQALKENLDKLGRRNLSKGFGFPVSLCPE